MLEKRYASMLKVLEESTSFLEGELRKRGVVSETGLQKLRVQALNDDNDLDVVRDDPGAADFDLEGEWKQQPTLFD